MRFVIPLVLLTGCTGISLNGDLSAFCKGSQITVNDHADALVVNGEAIISAGAGEVLVTGDQLVTIYDKACEGKF